MNVNAKRILIWSALALVLLAALVFAFIPRAVTVDIISLEREAMMLKLEEEGKTRIHDVFVLSAPVAGRVQRIDLHVGDSVVAGNTILAQIEPGDPTLLDPRTEAQARAAINAANSAYKLSVADVDRVSAELEYAESELRRARELIIDSSISQRALDDATRAYKTRKAAQATARANALMRQFELEQARAQLLSPVDTQEQHENCDCVPIIAPVNGRVLKIANQSERVVAAAEEIMQIGDPQDMEIIVDYLSADAVKIKPGQKVIIEGWGGAENLLGHVRHVEPFGYTKISALGIEEQRVNVVIDFDSPLEQRFSLGHGFQVDAQVVLWEASDVLTLPLTAIFRREGQWAVFVEEQGRAQLKTVELGQRNGLVAEVLSGLGSGDRVIVHPSNEIAAGVRVQH